MSNFETSTNTSTGDEFLQLSVVRQDDDVSTRLSDRPTHCAPHVPQDVAASHWRGRRPGFDGIAQDSSSYGVVSFLSILS